MEKDPVNDLSSSLASGPNDTMYETIAVVDDEQDILELVSLHLKKNHFNVREFSDGSSFIKYLDSKQPDLVVLDLMLPDADGFEICKYMNRKKNLSYITIVMLTAKSEETDTILGLELGADDYVRKPFSPNELIARVKLPAQRAGLPGKEISFIWCPLTPPTRRGLRGTFRSRQC
jgi:DNA-binding response OmpR family regulator